jgi:hypothetical protein
MCVCVHACVQRSYFGVGTPRLTNTCTRARGRTRTHMQRSVQYTERARASGSLPLYLSIWRHTSIHPYIHTSTHPYIHTPIRPSVRPSVSVSPTLVAPAAHTHTHTLSLSLPPSGDARRTLAGTYIESWFFFFFFLWNNSVFFIFCFFFVFSIVRFTVFSPLASATLPTARLYRAFISSWFFDFQFHFLRDKRQRQAKR